MSEQGPYTLIESDSYPTRIEGPNLPKVIGQPITMRMLKMLLNAAYSAGRLSASEQGKELTPRMIQNLADETYPGAGEDVTLRRIGFVDALTWAREKGYLSKTAGEQPSQSSTEGLGDAAQSSGPGSPLVSSPAEKDTAAIPIAERLFRAADMSNVLLNHWIQGTRKRSVLRMESMENHAELKAILEQVCHLDKRFAVLDKAFRELYPPPTQ